jgi:small subunit ribosomal protein S4e
MKRHLKRINAPKTWQIARKQTKWIKRPNPGSHSYNLGMSMVTLLKEVDHLAKTASEIRSILTNKEVFANGKRIKDANYLAGFMDVISIPSISYYRIITLNENGYIALQAIDEKATHQRLIKLTSKTLHKGKTQLGFLDGTTMLTEKNDYNVGDSFVIDVKDKKIQKHIPLKEAAHVIIYAGKKIGSQGKIKSMDKDLIVLETKEETFQTKKAYAFALP